MLLLMFVIAVAGLGGVFVAVVVVCGGGGFGSAFDGIVRFKAI